MIADALIVAAGRGTRTGSTVPKQFELLRGKPLIAHAFDAFQNHPSIGNIVVVIGRDQHEMLSEALGGRVASAIVEGGAERQDSVQSGLAVIKSEMVLIHDAARPIIPATVIDRLLTALESHNGAVPIVPLADTIARADEALGETISRDGVVRVQTPQAFRTASIVAAHAAHSGQAATDDAQLLRLMGHDVATIVGDVRLDKVTFPGDLARMEQEFPSPRIVRSGIGLKLVAN
jgi:2-C-methyl-D-erythritol 4-phosphate cytidylyltransferase / 2-C-methyl-D-erythritol 2,4-cyclodiphosphate synthase